MKRQTKNMLIALVVIILAIGAFYGYSVYKYQTTMSAVRSSQKAAESSKSKQESKNQASEEKSSQENEQSSSVDTSTGSEQSNSTDTVDSDAASLNIHQFENKYGMTYGQYLNKNTDLTIQQSLEKEEQIAGRDNMDSTDLQTLDGLRSGMLQETSDGKDVEENPDYDDSSDAVEDDD